MYVEPDSSSNPYWNESCDTCGTGDVNEDSIVNVADLVEIVNYILEVDLPTDEQRCATDINEDGIINIVDIVEIVQFILGDSLLSFSSSISNNLATYSDIIISDNEISLDSDGMVQGIQLNISHDDFLDIVLVDAFLSKYNTKDGITTILVVTDGSNLTKIASIKGEYEILSAIIVNKDSEIVTLGNIINIPSEFSLSAAYPNPFNPSTNIPFTLPETGYVSVKIYNILGQEVAVLADGIMNGGYEYTLSWNASDVASGVYLLRAEYDGSAKTQKLMLLK
tara:strand:- start:586 stop:1425 length:840 start_codon:yes stop_codon:yes gene_type:complete